VIWGVIVSIHIIIVQRETMRSGAAIIRVEDNEVDYLLTDLALRVTIPFGYTAKAPATRGPFEQDMMPNELVACGVEECEHGVGWWYGYRLEARGGRMMKNRHYCLTMLRPHLQRTCQQRLVVKR